MRPGVALVVTLGLSFGLFPTLALADEGGARTAFQGGPFVLVGAGAEQAPVMRRIIQLAGGPRARLVIVASDVKSSGAAAKAAQATFKKLGVKDVQIVIPNGEPSANQAASFHQATGFYFSAGDQRAFLSKLNKPSWLGALLGAWRRGAVVAGIGPGAMIWGDHAILGNDKQSTPLTGGGFGLLERTLVETKLSDPGGFKHLLLSTAKHSPDLGVGIERGTGLLLTNDGHIEVLGQGSVVLARPAGRPSGTPTSGASDARVRVLAAGERMDLARDPIFGRDSAQASIP